MLGVVFPDHKGWFYCSLLVFGGALVRNDHKIASTGRIAVGQTYFQENIVPRLFLAPAGSFETLFVWKKQSWEKFLSVSLGQTLEGGERNVIMHSKTFHIFNQEEWCHQQIVWNRKTREIKVGKTRRKDNWAGGGRLGAPRELSSCLRQCWEPTLRWKQSISRTSSAQIGLLKEEISDLTSD